MHKSIFLFILVTILAIHGNAQKSAALTEHYQNEYQTLKEFLKYSEAVEGDTNIDVKFYYIDIEVGIYSPYISGAVTILFEPVSENLSEVHISLNSALTVLDVSSPCSAFSQVNDEIVCTLDEAYNPGDLIEFTISYEGVPVEAGGYKGLRYESHNGGEPIIATLSTPYLAHYWYPCKDGPEDKPDSVYMDITIPDEEINGVPLMGVSNGVLENVIDNGETKTFQWRHRYPIVTYYVMAAISNYVTFQEQFTGTSGESFPLDYYVFQESLTISQAGVADLPEAMQFFSDVFGPYPFSNEKYGMTQLGFYGAIENQTNTIQNNLSPSWFDVSVHELGHMWFGDMITLANWHHSWLNEGFATYSEALWDEHLYGFNAYKNNMATNEFWLGGTLYLENATDTFNTFQTIFYTKGAYAVHMLRGVLGDDLFFEALLNYAQDPDLMYGNASTADLQASFEASSGLELDFFFEQWIYDEYWPHYYYNFGQNTNNELYFVIHQAQEELYNYRPVFEMPVRVKINYSGGGDTTITVWNDQQTQTYYLNLDQEVASVMIDPDKWILRKVLFKPDISVSVADRPTKDALRVYPNPFSSSINIIPECTGTALTDISVFDLQGRKMKRLFKGICQSGTVIQWDGSWTSGKRAEPGVYIIRINSGDVVYSERVVLQ
jgi:aminopeptidase N